MSTDQTRPMRPRPPTPSEQSGRDDAQDEVPASPQPRYERSAEPQTTRIDAPGQPSFRPSGYSPPPSSPASSAPPSPAPSPASSPAPSPAGWPDQPPQYSGKDSGNPVYGINPGSYGSPGAGSSRYAPPPSDGYGYEPPPAGRPRRRGRRRRRWMMSLFALIVVVILLVVADRVANAIAENTIANQIKTQANLNATPSVDIPGFPFLTQVISKDLHEVDINMSNIPAGPVTITSIHAVAKGVHINSSWNGGLVDNINGTAFVSFGAIGQALSATGASQIVNISLSQAGPNKVKATASFAGLASVTETATVTQSGNKITIAWDQNSGSGGGILGGVLGGNGPALPDLSFTLPPNVPAGLKLASVSVTSTGIVATVTAQHTNLTE